LLIIHAPRDGLGVRALPRVGLGTYNQGRDHRRERLPRLASFSLDSSRRWITKSDFMPPWDTDRQPNLNGSSTKSR
jgi:hypothetical protein